MLKSKYFTFSFQKYLPHLEKAFSEESDETKIDLEDRHEILASAWIFMLQAQVVLHLIQKSDESVENLVQMTQDYLEWTKMKALPFVQTSALAKYVINSLMMMSSNLATLNVCDLPLAHKAIERVQEVLNEGRKKF